MQITYDLKCWQIRNSISDAAMLELLSMFGIDYQDFSDQEFDQFSETGVQSRIRLEAAKQGWRLWRNNVGVLKNDRGVPVRYGLANETPAMNKNIKSSDLIGVKPVLIQQHHVGTVIGQFVAIEVKESNWSYTGKGREKAQFKFQQIVKSLGGEAKFANSVDSIF